MDGIPVQIIDIEKDDKTKKSTYNFKFDALLGILSQVNDIEVALISIGGPSRQGKSFILSYLLRYLSNSKEINWIGNNDEPLNGFKWNHGIEPETRGVWIWSKPLIVKQSVGKEIAIIIMDTQGVYDEYTDVRDWSTIMGITLLTSSCFIFNVFTDIQENVLTQLETFVNYGLLAMERDETNKHAFQRLLFLIRDWNHARDYNYGDSGGKKYITQKLSIKSNQPQQSQRTRQLINQCFEDVTCYLMPEPGPKKDEQDFDGSLDKLSPKFITKLKELFSVLLNPDSLKPKVINGNTITGRELFKFFEIFVEKFNGEELPQPMDLVESVAKATDLNLIYKLKEKYFFEMNKVLQTKHFLTKNEINVLNNSITSDIIEVFKTSKISQNIVIVKQIMQMLETELRIAYKKIYSNNKERREKTAHDTIFKCMNIYYENMNKFMNEDSFVKTTVFDEQSKESKNLAKKYFIDIFGAEDIDSYAPYLLKINELIEEKEDSIKSANLRRKSESKKINTQAIDDSLTLYCQQIISMLDKKVFLTSEKFSQYEREIRSEALKYFADKCSGDQDFVNKYQDIMRFRLNDENYKLQVLNRNKMKETVNNTEVELNLALNYCKQKLSEKLELFSGSEDLNQINAVIKQNTIEIFEHKCKVQESNFLSPYINKLVAEIDKIFVKFIEDFKTKTEDLNHFYKTTIEEAMNRCFEEIPTLINGKCLISDEDSVKFRETLIRDIIHKYENIPKYGKFDEIEDYVNRRTASAADLLLIDRLIEFYAEKMIETLRTKNFFSREELSQVHSEKSEQIIEIFKAHKKTSKSKHLEELIYKLNDKLKYNFNEYYLQNEQNREVYVEEAIDNSLSLYEECMDQKLKHVCIESNKFDELNAESKKKALKQLIDICGAEKELTDSYVSKLSKQIESAKTKFLSENDINISEAKRRNSEAVNKSLDYYSDQMNFALDNNQFYSKESFKRYENEVRDKSYERFTDNCKYGEMEFISQFELQLCNQIKVLKFRFKTYFHQKLEALESEIKIKINDSLSHYNEVMHHLLDAIKSEQQFITKHKELKASVIKKFNDQCFIKDDQYRQLQVSKLEKAIEDSCKEFRGIVLAQIKKSQAFYEKFVTNTFELYAELIRGHFSRHTLLSDEQLENLHQNVVKDVMSKLENNFRNEEDFSVIESNTRALELKIKNEFQSINAANRLRNESIERLKMEMKLKIKDFVKEYEERMENMLPFCYEESGLLENHLEIKNIIKENMIASNPFPDLKLLEPFLTKVEAEIDKSFNDFDIIFKVNLEKQLLNFQNVLTNARKFYRDEMQKNYTNTNFINPEDLILYNCSVTNRTIAKYQGERGNMSFDEFETTIKDSLKVIYNDIVEENDKNTLTSPSIGIDLGTTNSCVAFYEPSKPKGRTIIIPNDLGNRTTPSVVAFGDNNEEIIGETAKEQSYRNSRNTIYSAKRLIGRQFDDEKVQKDMLLWPFKVVDDGYNTAKISVKVDGNDKDFFPEEISAKILKKLKQTAEIHLGCDVKNAVITVPAYFTEAQKEATKDAGKIAGLNVLKIINEPTAAAIAFQLNRSDELGSRKVLMYDFGGGTLDVAVLSIERGLIDIKAVRGDNHLGGDDIDAKLVDFCLNDFTAKTQIQFDKTSEAGENALRRLTTECEKRKRQLSSTNSAQIIVDHFYEGTDLSCELTREKFEELNNDLFVKSIDLVSEVIFDANLKPSDIDDVVLVGGTTRISKIQEMLTDLFDGKPLNHSVNPDEAVAIGAAIQAAIINGNLARGGDLLRVSDVTPMSLGVKVKDGLMSTIIRRNSKVPNKYTKQYETTADNQNKVDIEIYEGEETMAEDNRKLGTFTLSNIPPSPAGQQHIDVNFIINDEGILQVKAKIISSGEEEEILITEHKGRLTNEELQLLIDQKNG